MKSSHELFVWVLLRVLYHLVFFSTSAHFNANGLHLTSKEVSRMYPGLFVASKNWTPKSWRFGSVQMIFRMTKLDDQPFPKDPCMVYLPNIYPHAGDFEISWRRDVNYLAVNLKGHEIWDCHTVIHKTTHPWDWYICLHLIHLPSGELRETGNHLQKCLGKGTIKINQM